MPLWSALLRKWGSAYKHQFYRVLQIRLPTLALAFKLGVPCNAAGILCSAFRCQKLKSGGKCKAQGFAGEGVYLTYMTELGVPCNAAIPPDFNF